MKKVLVMLILLFSSINGVSGLESHEPIIDLSKNYSYEQLYQLALALEKKYPDIITVEIMGVTNDGRNIFALVMGRGIDVTLALKENYVNKMHFLVEAGTHGRENVGPNVVMKTIETYARDYYDNDVILDYDLYDMLKNNVLHFIPLANPDGYDLTTQGIASISYPYRLKLRSYRDWKFNQYKSNLNGVDLNRNYPGYYYDLKLEKWRDLWNMIHNANRSFRPSGAFYFGPYAGSEIETQVMMTYLLKYDFRNYLSYHNRGEVIYYDKWMLSDVHNQRAYALAKKASSLSAYAVINTDKTTSSSGYMSDYIAMNTLKPSITLELNHYNIKLPAKPEFFREAYEKTKHIPLSFVEMGRATGYFKYRLYDQGIYVRDFEEKIYADQYAQEYGGLVIEGEGKPRYFLADHLNKLTRVEVIKEVMKAIDYDLQVDLYPFSDSDESDVLQARALKIISGFQNKFRPDDFITYGEFYAILHKSFFSSYEIKNKKNINLSKIWSLESFLVLVENEIVTYTDFRLGYISKGEVSDLMAKIQSELEP